ncbi:MAG TPA: TRAP transporter substrate-binding protein DctP [Polyangiales bacterium]|nr:TRAP transporter substrate-binding protein DctP [Polyangiales bacterium]
MAGHKVSVLRGLALALLATLLGVVPGTFAKATEEGQILKVALAIPRSQEIEIEVKKYNDKLAAMTNNSVKVRIYWGGAAGDDLDVLRKMKTGQMDATALSLELCSQFVRQALVLASPALFTNYKQLDAVRAAMTPQMDAEAYENGFKIMGWGDVGRLRLMSKEPVANLADFRRMRPWLYPQSEMLKDFYKQVNATGVPLGLIEVYGALQTNMIDVVWISSLLGGAMQWHTATHYISEQGLGFISGAFIIRRGAWDALPQNVKDSMLKLANETRQKNQIEARKADERAYKKLIERGHKPVKLTNLAEWQKVGEAVREHMVGRIYTRELLQKAESIAKQYQD